MQQVFRYIPRQLGKKAKYSNMVREEPSRGVKNTIELLANARICHQVYHSHCTGIPLYADINPNTYKLLFMDVGMTNNICGYDWIFLESVDDRSLVKVQVRAVDDTQLVQLDLLIDGNLRRTTHCNASFCEMQVPWNTRKGTVGRHWLSAVAYAGAGSDGVTAITVIVE